MTDKIRVGIIGANANYGWSKRAHLPALLGMPDFELTAVCTSRAETAEESKDLLRRKARLPRLHRDGQPPRR